MVGVTKANLTVEPGQICVLMGLSGSGKSTLLRAVNRLNQPTRGDVLVRHRDRVVNVTTCDAATLRDLRGTSVAMVFQQFALLPWRSVRDNVGMGLELRGMGRAERDRIVTEKLEMVGLGRWADKYAHELSGGMQQRVGLARAFATDADILLMDEPFSALDPLIRTRLQDELLELQARLRKTILFVSHDLDEAIKLGNRIVIMEGGRIVQAGTVQDIVLRPADSYVEDFVKHMNPLDALRADTFMMPLADHPREGHTLLTGHAHGIRIEIDAAGCATGITVDGVPGADSGGGRSRWPWGASRDRALRPAAQTGGGAASWRQQCASRRRQGWCPFGHCVRQRYFQGPATGLIMRPNAPGVGRDSGLSRAVVTIGLTQDLE